MMKLMALRILATLMTTATEVRDGDSDDVGGVDGNHRKEEEKGKKEKETDKAEDDEEEEEEEEEGE